MVRLGNMVRHRPGVSLIRRVRLRASSWPARPAIDGRLGDPAQVGMRDVVRRQTALRTRSVKPITTVSRLLKLWTMPLDSRPTISRRLGALQFPLQAPLPGHIDHQDRHVTSGFTGGGRPTFLQPSRRGLDQGKPTFAAIPGPIVHSVRPDTRPGPVQHRAQTFAIIRHDEDWYQKFASPTAASSYPVVRRAGGCCRPYAGAGSHCGTISGSDSIRPRYFSSGRGPPPARTDRR